MIREINAQDLRRMNGKEGLILQGCGGSLDEWVDGINEILTKESILLDGTKFHDAVTFENEGLTCLLFPFTDDIKLDVGKLAVWRLGTHGSFGGTWLSDYVDNRLGGLLSADEKTVQNVMDQSEFILKVNQYYADVDLIEIDTSPDFQCEQSGGFPVSLEVCWQKEKAWLMPHRSYFYDLEKENPDYAKEVMQCCADFGIRDCRSVFDYNNLLRELGEEALENAELPEPDDDQNMGGI